MFVAASTRSFADKTLAEACNLVADLEFDKIELWLDESSPGLKPSQIAEDPDRIYALFRETTRLTPVAFYLEHDVPEETFASISKLAKLMKVAQITVPSSPLGTPFNSEIDRLKLFLAIANRDGVRVSFKTQTGTLSEDARTAVELCESVRGIGLTFDPSYYLVQGQVPEELDAVYPHVLHVHLRDTSPSELQVPVGLGELDYSRLIAQLARVGYNRSLAVDLLPPHTDDEARALELRKLRMLLETLL